MAQQPPVDQCLLIGKASRSHSDTPHSIGHLWTIDQPVARDLYLTTHNTHKRQSSMPLSEFEPIIPVSEQPQTHALDRAATGIGVLLLWNKIMYRYFIIRHYLVLRKLLFILSVTSNSGHRFGVSVKCGPQVPKRCRPLMHVMSGSCDDKQV